MPKNASHGEKKITTGGLTIVNVSSSRINFLWLCFPPLVSVCNGSGAFTFWCSVVVDAWTLAFFQVDEDMFLFFIHFFSHWSIVMASAFIYHNDSVKKKNLQHPLDKRRKTRQKQVFFPLHLLKVRALFFAHFWIILTAFAVSYKEQSTSFTHFITLRICFTL